MDSLGVTHKVVIIHPSICHLSFVLLLPRTVSPRGYLVSVDAYMNLQLANTEEFVDGQSTGHLGEVLIRCGDSSGSGSVT